MSDDMLNALRSEHEQVFGDDACPAWARESLLRYVSDGIPPGDCLRAFLANDLMGAVGRADVNTGRCVAAIAGYIYRNIPSIAHGSYERVDAWLVRHADRRRQARLDAEAK